VAIVVFGENPYAEWHGDIKSIEYQGPSDDGHEVDMQRPAPEVSALDEANPTVSEASRPQPPAAPNADLALLQRLRQGGIPVVAVFLTGRVRGVTPELEASNAFAVAWWPGTEGGGIADVLFRKGNGEVNFPITGKLSYAWPRGDGGSSGSLLFPYGYGLGGCIRH
jgi:beta-glucosidase